MPQLEKKIEEILREAAAAVAAADVPEDLRSVAFGKAVDLIAGVSTASDTGARVEVRARRQQRQAGSIGNPLEMISGNFEAEIE